MACRGVFFALSKEERDRLVAFASDDQRLNYITDTIEARWDKEHLLETDKAWDAIHRCLTDGSLSRRRSKNPLGKLILGGRSIYSGENYIINLIEVEELPELARALAAITKESFLKRYDSLRDTDYWSYPISDMDRQYTWDWFSSIPAFVARAAAESRALVFTVDQ